MTIENDTKSSLLTQKGGMGYNKIERISAEPCADKGVIILPRHKGSIKPRKEVEKNETSYE